MNIVIEARALAAASGGVKTYTYELIKNLLAIHPEAVYELIYGSQKPVGSFPHVQETVIPLRSDLLLSYWMSVQIARHVRVTKPSVVHFTKAALPYKKTAPTVVTIYDIIPLLFPETQSPLRRLYWPHVLERAAKTSDHILTISQRSKLDIMEHFRIAEDKITVTPLAVDMKHFKPVGKTPRVEETGAPYILFVGTRDIRKNITSLIRAFGQIADKIPHKLMIVGKPAKKQDSSKLTVVSCKLENRVQFLENVSYNQLPALYSGADIFVWPSIYEGWAFPPQEAMACGTPVIVSNGGPLPEVVGDAGVIVPLQEGSFDEKLAQEMLSLIQDEKRKKDLSRRGIAQTLKFSWKDIAEKTWGVYKKVSGV